MPRFSRADVYRRQYKAIVAIFAASCMLVSIGTLVSTIAAGQPSDQRTVPAAAPTPATARVMTIPETPTDASALSNLPHGVELTEGESLGIDVSSHQKTIDWGDVADAGVSFAYIKATEGTGYTDPKFAANWEGATKNGITPGAYHYFTLCSPGADQARDFLKAAPPDSVALPPALDLEFDGACDERPEAQHANAEVADFVSIVEKAWGRKLVIYSSAEWRRHYDLPHAEGRPTWLFPGRRDPRRIAGRYGSCGLTAQSTEFPRRSILT
ncbi:glycoside hydrolase family 25 protein [Dermabacter hominis]